MAARTLILLLIAGLASAADPAVEAALELPREEAIHYVDAVLALVDLGEPEKAQQIAEELAARELTDEARVELVAEAGAARLLRLAKVAPAVAEAVNAALRSAEAANLDPQRLRGRFTTLTTGDAGEARGALLELERTGATGVRLGYELLRGAKDSKHAARLREALVALYPASGPTLVVALEDENPTVRAEAAYAWGRLASLDQVRSPLPAALLAGRCLLGSSDEPSSEAAAWSFTQLTGKSVDLTAIGLIESSLDALLAGTLPFPADAEGRLDWPMGEGGQTERLPARDVALRLAAVLADDLAQLKGGDESAERLATALALQTDRPRAEGREPAELPTTELSECLRLALRDNLSRAAVRCCELLGERKDAVALLLGGAQPAPLASALESPFDAVRFAALQAILAIDSPTPFPGSSRVADALQYFAAGAGERKAVVIAPQIARASAVAAWLGPAGYDATPVNNGAEGIDAAASPDVELILLDLDTLLPSARETLFRLRRSPETASLPVGLLAADGRYLAAQSLADEHRGVLASARLQSAEDAAAFVTRLAALRSSDDPTPEQRNVRARQAGEWVAELLQSGPNYYRLRRNTALVSRTLRVPSGDRSFDALAALGSPESQRVLADAASRGGANIDVRRSAAEAFERSVRRHGMLLSRDEIVRQYDRYNASETADADTQAVLGLVLDAIEAGRDRGVAAETEGPEEVFDR